jgi:hypothetical protein
MQAVESRLERNAGSAGGISPPAAHRTVRKPLGLYGSSQPFPCLLATAKRLRKLMLLLVSQLAMTLAKLVHPLRSTSITEASTLLRDGPPPACASILSPFVDLTYKVFSSAKTRVAPSEHRIPRGQYTVLRHPCPGKERRPRFRYRLTCFRCVIDGSLALASLIHTCRSSSPAFDRNVHHRTLSNEAAYGGLKPVTAADRLRRAFLHHEYSIDSSTT